MYPDIDPNPTRKHCKMTKAHRDSRKFRFDPTYGTGHATPPVQTFDDAPFWRYGHYECEAFLLERMVRREQDAKLKVGYTSNRRKPAADAFFTLDSPVAGTIEFRACGKIEARVDGKVIYAAPDSDRNHTLCIENPGRLVLHLHADDTAKTIPALLPLNVIDGWLYSPDGQDFQPPVQRARRADGQVPHLAELPWIKLDVKEIGEHRFDAGMELLAEVEIESAVKPDLYIGESIPEMENENAGDEEQTREVVPAGPGKWHSKVPLALRFLRVKNDPDAKISLKAFFHPVEYRGAFAVKGMPELTDFWMHAAYTLRLCMNQFLLDGIKRDRLPWAGDLAVSLQSNAYSFGDGTIVRDSLSVLAATGIRRGHINDIADYTLWWLISHDLYQRFYGDGDFLRLEYPRIVETLDELKKRTSAEGFLQLVPGENSIFFIDWVPGEKITAEQMIYVMAQHAAARLADRMGDRGRAGELRASAAALAKRLRETAWDARKKLFSSAPGNQEFLRHPNLLAVISGVATAAESRAIAKALTEKEMPPVGTPYMSVFESLAIAKGGLFEGALEHIRAIWGGMLSMGATSFFEGYDPDRSVQENYVFYDRPFGCSLCHAWGSGPLFLLPQLLTGLEPVGDGWTTFRVNPRPGVTCSAAVPTPRGIIEVEIADGKIVRLDAPEGCTPVKGS